VDDGSTDGTTGVLGAAVERSPDLIRLKVLSTNRGKAEAVRAGLQHAIALGAGTIGYLDADLATPLEELEAMLDLLEHEQNLVGVLASRVRLLGRTIQRHAWRHYLGRVFATAASLTLGMAVYDTQCGAKIFRVQSYFDDILEHPFQARWVFDVELLARLRNWDEHVDDRLHEYPLRRWIDVGGSKLRLHDFLGAARDLFRIWRQPGRRPESIAADPRTQSLPRTR
jgi:glycosyltransferase involved in cell wall biosynthesis